MPYSEILIRPMREDLTRLGVEELKTPEAVDDAVQNSKGTLMLIVNSDLRLRRRKSATRRGARARKWSEARQVATVFAGADIEATERARSYFTGYRPSSPSIGLLKDGQLVYMLERFQIEGRDAEQIAGELTQAFEKFC